MEEADELIKLNEINTSYKIIGKIEIKNYDSLYYAFKYSEYEKYKNYYSSLEEFEINTYKFFYYEIKSNGIVYENENPIFRINNFEQEHHFYMIDNNGYILMLKKTNERKFINEKTEIIGNFKIILDKTMKYKISQDGFIHAFAFKCQEEKVFKKLQINMNFIEGSAFVNLYGYASILSNRPVKISKSKIMVKLKNKMEKSIKYNLY